MKLNPYLLQFLETCEADQLHALLKWSKTHAFETGSETPGLQAIMDPVPPPFFPSPNAVLTVEDKISFLLLEEFGPDFNKKMNLQWLCCFVSQKLMSASIN